MKVLILLVCILTVSCTHPKGGRKVTFSMATTFDIDNLEFNEHEPEFGSEEFYECHKWIAVSSDGFEYELGSVEEIMADLSPDIAGQGTYEKELPVNRALNDIPNPYTNDDVGAAGSDPALRDLVKSLKQQRHQIAEKSCVIGFDNRQMVSPPNRFPFTAIGKIDYGCTGTFIAKRTILTAGHCVHEGGLGGRWAQNLNFHRCKDCDPNNGYKHTWKWAVSFLGWTLRGLANFDIAVIIVHEPSPAQMVFKSESHLLPEKINIAGYPYDIPGQCMWLSSCTLTEANEHVLLYPCDTNKGMSGSAVYKYCPVSNTPVINAVHVRRQGFFINIGTRITAFYERRIREWIITYEGN